MDVFLSSLRTPHRHPSDLFWQGFPCETAARCRQSPGRKDASIQQAQFWASLNVARSRRRRREAWRLRASDDSSAGSNSGQQHISPDPSLNSHVAPAGSAFPATPASSPPRSPSKSSYSDHQPGTAQQTVQGPQLGHPELPYGAVTALAVLGAAETAYLTFEKLFGGPLTCPFGGGCNDVLDSSYGTLLGIPLSLYGFLSYASVGILTQISRINAKRSLLKDNARWALLGLTTAMAGVSTFLLYVIKSELDSAFCAYCYVSAGLSFLLFGLSFQGFSRQEITKALVPQTGILAATALALVIGFNDPRSAYAGVQEIDIPPIEPEVTTVSTPFEVRLAKHLSSVGAKMYGAFWCSHCYEQKQAFGLEAAKNLPYVECYPEGYRRGVKIAQSCEDAKIEGFPTWVINGELRPGEQELGELARLTGFEMK